jgi:hypothetical protein
MFLAKERIAVSIIIGLMTKQKSFEKSTDQKK